LHYKSAELQLLLGVFKEEFFMRFFLISAIFLFSTFASAQEKTGNDPDSVFKSFAAAYFMHDLKKMQSLTVYTENLKTLLGMPRLGVKKSWKQSVKI
jgi:hypothetical protein